MKRRGDTTQDEADALLSAWGSNSELIQQGGYASQNHICAHERGGGGSGHSDPTFQKVKTRQHLLAVQSAVDALPAQPKHRLYEEYVSGLKAHECGPERGVRMERDAARLAFFAVYEDRKRRARAGTMYSVSEDEGVLEVVSNT